MTQPILIAQISGNAREQAEQIAWCQANGVVYDMAPPDAAGGKVPVGVEVDLKAGMSVAIRVDPATGRLWVEPDPPGNDRGALWAVLASAWDQGYAEHAEGPRDQWPNPYREAVQ